MSRTLAIELAERTLAVVNPRNREMALRSGLARHGFSAAGVVFPDAIADRAALSAWLQETFVSQG